MEEYEDLGQYNGDPAHDMNVDFDHYNNTGELADLFDEDAMDDFISNLDDWD